MSKRTPLLRQNSELRKDRIWNWTLPAFVTKLPDGRNLNVCPQAGACASLCYARQGTYNFPAVRAAHQRNLLATLDHLEEWTAEMLAELSARKFRPTGTRRLPDLDHSHLSTTVQNLLREGCAAVRIHDAGDFYSDEYLLAWCIIAANTPDVLFYAYTKELTRFRRIIRDYGLPDNFLWVYSMGGKEDHLLNPDTERHAEVYPTKQALDEAGAYDQEENDLLCVLAPSNRVGIVTNNIPAFRKRQGDRTFGDIESASTRHGRAAQ